MKPEKEFKYIILLLNSQHMKSFLATKIGACKKDFEKILDAPENNKEFNDWINELIQEGSLEHNGRLQKGNTMVRGYLVNEKALLQRFKDNGLFEPAKKYFRKDVII